MAKGGGCLKRGLLLLLVLGAALFLVGPLLWPAPAATETRYGVTYSTMHAAYFGLDPVEGFREVAETLNVDLVRVPVYWDRIAPEPGVYEFAELDAVLEIAEEQDTDIILAIGRRVPRWPECFIPAWAEAYSAQQLAETQLAMMEQVVRRYADHPQLVRWQVENEPYFQWFGECPPIDRPLIEREFELVRTLDGDTPIQTTASGEQSLWRRASKHADIVGASLYRTTYTPKIGYITYPVPAWTYRAKAALFVAPEDTVVISELQAEPWIPGSFYEVSVEEQLEVFDAQTLQAHLDYAEQTGFEEVLLWGVEWWMYLRAQGNDTLWNTAQMLWE